MSYFVPMNVPIAIGLSLSTPTVVNVAFWQFMNQSYNFGVNFANGNKSNQVSNQELAMKFLIAVTSSITIGLTAKHLISKSRYRDNYIFQRFSPFLGVSGANVVNLLTARYSDTVHGITVKDSKTGEIIPDAKSPIAGKKAFWQTALSRVLIPLPVSFVPPIMITLATKGGFLPKSAIGSHMFNIGVSTATLMGALPLALACFP
mmetsp:Transcript_12763/g.10910  ORF Transcript_12763/g.10910 Transcript_12763/m.10910 type:complete len:204 (-) Transcript_12763:389-1000(-)